MEIKEQHVIRLTIEHSRGGRDEVSEYLDKRFGEYGYRVTRSGPKLIDVAECDPKLSQIIVEAHEDVLEQIIDHPNLKVFNTGRKGRFWLETAEEIRELL